MPSINLEEPECFAAWVSAKETGFAVTGEIPDPKINLGGLLLQALLEHWPATYPSLDEEQDNDGNQVNGNVTVEDEADTSDSPGPYVPPAHRNPPAVPVPGLLLSLHRC